MSLNGLEQPPELPLMGPLSGAKPPPRWQPPETGFDPQHMQCLRFTCARVRETRMKHLTGRARPGSDHNRGDQ